MIFIRYLFSITTCSIRVFFGSSSFGATTGGDGVVVAVVGFNREMGSFGVTVAEPDTVVEEAGRKEEFSEVGCGTNIWSDVADRCRSCCCCLLSIVEVVTTGCEMGSCHKSKYVKCDISYFFKHG